MIPLCHIVTHFDILLVILSSYRLVFEISLKFHLLKYSGISDDFVKKVRKSKFKQKFAFGTYINKRQFVYSYFDFFKNKVGLEKQTFT